MSDWPLALERLRGTVGVWTMTLEYLEIGASREVVAELDGLGYAALWVPEAWGREALTHATLLLSATSRLVVATGIANIWARDPVAAANAARTLSAAFDDRFVLGLGVSHRPLVERLRGHDYRAPLAAMRAYLAAMDAAPMVSAEGRRRYSRVLAALGPRMLALAATAADGAHPTSSPPSTPRWPARRWGPASSASSRPSSWAEGREEFLARAHAHLEFYTGLENYRDNWRRLGFSDEDFVRGGSTRLCEAMVVHVRRGRRPHARARAPRRRRRPRLSPGPGRRRDERAPGRVASPGSRARRRVVEHPRHGPLTALDAPGVDRARARRPTSRG